MSKKIEEVKPETEMPTLEPLPHDDPFSFKPINCFVCSKHGNVEGFSIWTSSHTKCYTFCRECVIEELLKSGAARHTND